MVKKDLLKPTKWKIILTLALLVPLVFLVGILLGITVVYYVNNVIVAWLLSLIVTVMVGYLIAGFLDMRFNLNKLVENKKIKIVILSFFVLFVLISAVYIIILVDVLFFYPELSYHRPDPKQGSYMISYEKCKRVAVEGCVPQGPIAIKMEGVKLVSEYEWLPDKCVDLPDVGTYYDCMSGMFVERIPAGYAVKVINKTVLIPYIP